MGIWVLLAISPHRTPVKTTLDLSDDLLRRAKQAALDRGTTLRAIVEEGLERLLGPATVDAPLRLVTWPPAALSAAAPRGKGARR
jgi:hypothetical protein